MCDENVPLIDGASMDVDVVDSESVSTHRMPTGRHVSRVRVLSIHLNSSMYELVRATRATLAP